MLDGHWHFQCPECGMGISSLAASPADDELLCEVCVEEGRGERRLEHRLADEKVPLYARLRPVLAA